MQDRYIPDPSLPMSGGAEWALGETTIGKVAIASLEKIIHKTFSGVEGWKSWYERERQ